MAEPSGFTDDIRAAKREMRDAFHEAVQSYENLRGYVADKYGDHEPDVTAWLREKHVLFVEGVPDSDPWRDQYMDASQRINELLRQDDEGTEEVVQSIFEDALEADEPWVRDTQSGRADG